MMARGFAGSAPIFSALGDETRLRIVARLCSGGSQSISSLTAGSSISRQAVTKHLRVLAGAGLVRGVRKGRESRWELEPTQIQVARRYLEWMSERWEESLSSLERHLDAMAEPQHGTGQGRTRAESAVNRSHRRSVPEPLVVSGRRKGRPSRGRERKKA